VFRQFFWHFFCAPKLQLTHLFQVSINSLKTTDSLEHSQGCFFTHTGNTGNVIRLVTDQRQVVDNQFWWNTKLINHTLPTHVCFCHGVDECYVLIHQLRHVLISRGDHHWALLG